MTRGTQAGFTLLELLVGLVVLGFILAGLTQGTRYGLRAAETQARLAEGRGELDAVDRALRRLFEQADPGSAHRGPPLLGTEGRVAIVSVLPAAVAGYVGREADVALGLGADHRLMLRWTPHAHVKRLGPSPPVQEAELVRGVERLELGYYADTWRTSWDRPALPSLVRLRIVFPANDPRHWPDIVVALLRQPAK